MPQHVITPSETDDVTSTFYVTATAHVTPIRTAGTCDTGFTIRNPRLGKPKRVTGRCETGFTIEPPILEGGTEEGEWLWR